MNKSNWDPELDAEENYELGRASAFTEMTDLSLYKRGRAEAYAEERAFLTKVHLKLNAFYILKDKEREKCIDIIKDNIKEELNRLSPERTKIKELKDKAIAKLASLKGRIKK